MKLIVMRIAHKCFPRAVTVIPLHTHGRLELPVSSMKGKEYG